MVRPIKTSELPGINFKKLGNNFQKITNLSNMKKIDTPEKFKNEIKKVEKPGINLKPRALPFKSNPDKLFHSCTTPSINKVEQKDISIKLTKKSSHISMRKEKNVKNERKSNLGTKKPKTRSILTKNIPLVATSELLRPKVKKLRQSKTLKLKNTKLLPLSEKYFKPEGKIQEDTPSKGHTPKIEEKREKLKIELEFEKDILTDKNESSDIPNILQIPKKEGLKISPKKSSLLEKTKTHKKFEIPLPKNKNTNVLLQDFEKKFHFKKFLTPRSDLTNEEIKEKGIKHNDSFVLSAKKLQSFTKVSKRPKPEVLRLYKKKEDTSKKLLVNAKLKSCLKKNSEVENKVICNENVIDKKKITKKIQNVNVKSLAK